MHFHFLNTPFRYIIAVLLLLCGAAGTVHAQLGDVINRFPRGGGGGGGGGGDSLQRRSAYDDSISINFRFLDSTRSYAFDSTLNDFTRRFPIPATHVYLGNNGSATRSLLFAPVARAGWDPGFHAFDVYKWKQEHVRFYNTTRPYTELNYFLASKNEQLIEVLHTQNLKPYWNASFHYRLINSRGFFSNQKTNHNNYLLSSWYQSPKKRYNNYFMILANSLQSGESGGIRRDQDYLNQLGYDDRYVIPSKIGGEPDPSRDFFSTTIATGNRYRETSFMLRQQYDLGKKDSVVTDSIVIPLFYPRLRFEHTLKLNKYNYHFFDYANSDTAYYATRYNFSAPSGDSLTFRDQWREVNNDFSIYQFPDARNLHQFIKVGLEAQLLRGTFKNASENIYNLIGHGEYRNRTRNQKWDIEAFGRLHLTGYNLGDYHAFVSLTSLLGRRFGTLQVGFENTNRTAPYLFNGRSSFYLDDPGKSFSKENMVHFFGGTSISALKLRLGADYYLLTNYLYLTDFYKLQQERALFNVLRLHASKTFSLGRFWRWYADVWVQEKTGNVQLNMPTLYTRNRLVFEGNFFRNLNLASGLEVRYHTPYQADNYSPVLGQFFFQDAITISNRPEVAAFMHFRIRSFKAFLRAENLNSMNVGENGFGFNYNNLAAPDYLMPGLLIRVGFAWSFIN